MMNPNLGGSITNDDWISEEEVADPKELPNIPGFHILVRPVTAKKKTKGGIIIPDSTKDDNTKDNKDKKDDDVVDADFEEVKDEKKDGNQEKSA